MSPSSNHIVGMCRVCGNKIRLNEAGFITTHVVPGEGYCSGQGTLPLGHRQVVYPPPALKPPNPDEPVSPMPRAVALRQWAFAQTSVLSTPTQRIDDAKKILDYITGKEDT